MHNAVVTLDSQISARLKRNADGLVCAVVQQHDSREVLMVGWMDDEALIAALKSGHVRAAGLDVYDGEPRVHQPVGVGAGRRRGRRAELHAP